MAGVATVVWGDEGSFAVPGDPSSVLAALGLDRRTEQLREKKEKVADLPADSRVPQAAIAVTPNGDVYIVYEQDPEFGASTIVLATNATGSWVTTPVPLSSAGGAIESPQFPDIASLSDGSVAVVFQADQQDPPPSKDVAKDASDEQERRLDDGRSR